MRKITLQAQTAHDARREIAQRWPNLDVTYSGYNAEGICVIGGLVRRRGMSSGRLGGKPRKPGAHTPIRFVARVDEPLNLGPQGHEDFLVQEISNQRIVQ